MDKIQVKVSMWNQIKYPEGCTKEICCGSGLQIRETYWKQPLISIDGVLLGYTKITPTATDGSDKPSTDSYKVVKVISCGNTVEVVVADDETAQKIIDACNACCGDAPIAFDHTIPAAILEYQPCEDANGDRKIAVVYPDGGVLNVSGTFEGVAMSPAPTNPYASGAAIKTAWDANWTAYGTMVHDVTNKTLVITLAVGVDSGMLTITV